MSDDLPDIVVIIEQPSTESIIIVEQVVEVLEVTTAPRGPQGPAGYFDQQALESAVGDYLLDNPLDIDAPDLTTFFENGLT